MKFSKNGEFKILVIADCQDRAEPDPRMISFIGDMLDCTKPDLVIFTGDNVAEGSNEAFRQGAEAILRPLTERFVPYAYTFGNHDNEWGVPKEFQRDVFRSLGNCLTYDGAPFVTGVGNCVLPVKSSDGTRTAYNLWIIDSNAYDKENGGYDHIHPDQLDWIERTAKMRNRKEGAVIPSMFFQHIIPSEGFDFLCETELPAGTEGTKAYGGKNYELRLNSNVRGYLGEFPCPPTVNSGEMELLSRLGGVVGVVVGHDHSNAFIGRVMGIDIIQCPGVSFKAYGDDNCRGCCLITLHEDAPEKYDAWFCTCAANESGEYKSR